MKPDYNRDKIYVILQLMNKECSLYIIVIVYSLNILL